MNDVRWVARELTPRGTGGVSVIEVRGVDALERVRILLGGLPVSPGLPRVARLSADREELDECLVHCIDREHVELHVHGNPTLVRRVLRELGGETNDVATCVRERAQKLLESAPCEAAARILLDQAEGAWERAISSWNACTDAALEAQLEAVLARSRDAQFALRPAVVVLAGPVNAGKSTLFNLLVGRERVAVSSAPGTTRDVIVERIAFGEWPVDLVDTAGERSLDHVGDIERAGIGMAREVRSSADLVLWLSALDEPLPAPFWPVPTAELHTRASAAHLDAAATPARIDVLADPGHASRVVCATFRQALHLPADPWCAGAPIAFDAPSRHALEASLRTLRSEGRPAADALLCALVGVPAR